MEWFSSFWSAYVICYAIGYMLWIRPRLQSKKWDMAFYASLLILSTVRYLV
jgi:hypothetical protein